jgi:hypothetical protein
MDNVQKCNCMSINIPLSQTFISHESRVGARSSVDGWGIMLQVRRLWVWVPMWSLNFLNLPNPSSHTMVLGFTQPLTEWVSEDTSVGKAQPAHKADNLTAIYELIV